MFHGERQILKEGLMGRLKKSVKKDLIPPSPGGEELC